MNPIGIIHGRLSPPLYGRIQSFPVNSWRDEFVLAKQAGLSCIEWIYEVDNEELNPLGSQDGIAEIRELIASTGVEVWSICADYYMVKHLIDDDGVVSSQVATHLQWLIQQATLLNVKYIVLPFVDSSALKTTVAVEGLFKLLQVVLPTAEQVGIELHLETDLQPTQLVSILQEVSHPLVRSNYDIGNSASLGYDPVEELTLLKPWLGSVHVKDRLLGGGTVPLGTGAADLPTCFRLITEANFQGPFILQVARETGLNEVNLAIRNRQFVENQLRAL